MFKRVLDRALRYPQLSFIKTPVEAFDTQMHTQSNASYVLFFFFRFLVIAIGNWGRCYWWYVFVRTCASRSTQHAEIIQHMLENLALIALHKLCNTCSKKRHKRKDENGREGKSETASQGWLKKGNNKKIRYKTMWKRNKEGWNWKGCLRRNCVAVWPNLAVAWVRLSQQIKNQILQPW